ncbi:hypothetical protein CSHISOI_08193, partial [Colletotrichum shisoi]
EASSRRYHLPVCPSNHRIHLIKHTHLHIDILLTDPLPAVLQQTLKLHNMRFTLVSLLSLSALALALAQDRAHV